MSPSYYTTLNINQLQIMVKLGVPDEERAIPQPVEIDITFLFPSLPDECKDDDSNSYICYDEISKNIQEYAEKNEFKLLEYLGYQIFLLLRNYLPEDIGVITKVRKCNPPVDAIKGGCTVVHSDLPIRVR